MWSILAEAITLPRARFALAAFPIFPPISVTLRRWFRSVNHYLLRSCSIARLISGPGRDGSIHFLGLAVDSFPTHTAPQALSAARNAALLSSICPVPMWRRCVPRLSEMTFGALDLEMREHFFGHGFSRSCHLPQDLHIRSILITPETVS